MSSVEQLLQRFIAEHRKSGHANARRYLEQVGGTDRVELAAHIDRYLAEPRRGAFDPVAFARFRADPRRQAMVERVLDDTTLEALRKQASLSKAEVAQSLAASLQLEGREQAVKARYHDIEQGSVDPTRIRTRVWEALATLFGAQAERLRAAAESGFAGGLGGAPGAVYARSSESAGLAAMADPGAPSPEEDEVDRALFED